MQKLFNKILVPVDFSTKSKKAIDRAIDIACEYQCSICLLHVALVTPFSTLAMADGHITVPFNMLSNKKELEFQLEKLRSYISMYSGNKVESSYRIMLGSWNEVIIEFAEENHIDLILIGQEDYFQKKRKMMLNPDTIALRTSIPVITVPSNRRLTRLFSIVIPITDFLPTRKLMYGIYIASTYDTVVKLLGIENEKTHSKMEHYLQRAAWLIRDNSSVKVDTEVIHSANVAEAVDRFTRKQHADLLILNPNTQTRMPGIFSSIMGNIIQKYSSPPVLTVTPV